MSFFRRGEDRPGMRASYDRSGVATAPSADPAEPVLVSESQEARVFEALGSAIEKHEQDAASLLSGAAMLQSGLAVLIEDHGRSMHEVGQLRTECARLEAQLQQETAARLRAEGQGARFAAESRDLAAELGQLRLEADALRQEFAKLEGLHQVTFEERAVFEARLFDVESELKAQIRQYDEAALLMKKAQQELDARSRELSATREKLENETTAHQLLIETSRRDATVQSRELMRLTDERNQLKASTAEQETLVRSLQMNVATLRQEGQSYEDRYRRLEGEYESLQSSAALESAQLSSRVEAMNSKVLLAEKLLATANGRNRVTDDELHVTKAELKRVKTDFATLSSRAERVGDELARVRAIGSESESARRELAAQNNDLTGRLRQAEEMRAKAEREADMLKRDMDARAEADRLEIGQLRTSLEIARSEARQMKTEHAILTGQLEAARGDRTRMPVAQQLPDLAVEEQGWAARTVAQPIIEISDAAMRGNGVRSGSENPAVHEEPPRLPAE